MTSAHGPEDVRIFHKECTTLARAGYEVYLVERGESYEKNGVHIVGIGQVNVRRMTRMLCVTRQIYRAALAVDADIYHFHDPELLPYGRKLKKLGKTVIFDSHENTADQLLEKPWIPKVLRKLVYRIYSAYQRRSCRELDAVISVSPHICEFFSAFHPRVVMVTNYPQYQEVAHSDAGRDRTLCFAGGITAQWNHERIIRALPGTDARYVLVGPPDQAYLERLRNLPGWERVEYRRKIPHEEVAQVMSQCVAGVSVLSYSYNTGFRRGTLGNTKIYEEMMAGLPVICSKSQLWQEMVDRYHCGITVEPDSDEEVAAAIRYLLDHPDEAREMGENGRRAVRETYNWGVEEKKLLSLYADLSKGAGPEAEHCGR